MLTRGQAKALAFIRDFILEHERSPSYPEIATAIGLAVSSKARVSEIVNALIAKGRLARLGSRSLVLASDDNTITIHLESDMAFRAKYLAEMTKVSVEAILLEALRDRLLFSQRSGFVTHENPGAGPLRKAGPAPVSVPQDTRGAA